MAFNVNRVCELQGLYGPFVMAERVLQKIWLRGDFDRRRAQLSDGRPLRILAPGEWNRLGGPDFCGARLAMDGREVCGDVEVHFHQADWAFHRHVANPSFDRVVLHVVLFPPHKESCARDRHGREIPTLVLLPLLARDLEEYASDDALEALTARDEQERFAALLEMPVGEMHRILRHHAEVRWRQKVRYAGLRTGRLGWSGALHATALEILGYRRNRAIMLEVAGRHPLEAWGHGTDAAARFQELAGRWQLHGLRPANHPRVRLQQYVRWVEHAPAWPEALGDLVAAHAGKTGCGFPEAADRRSLGLSHLRRAIATQVLGEAVTGTRLDNLIADGFLPLVAAGQGIDLFPQWFHARVGDQPGQVRRVLRRLGFRGRESAPASQGWAQGLLGWILEARPGASDCGHENLPGLDKR
ncbi:MAG: DUF2851 family protein [Opitutaceae bacterium]|nr:DUF2851 family protein [Opitutaceae bacterium]